MKKISAFFLFFILSSCSIIEIMKEDEIQDDLTNNRRHIYIHNYGKLESVKERYEMHFYDQDWQYKEDEY